MISNAMMLISIAMLKELASVDFVMAAGGGSTKDGEGHYASLGPLYFLFTTLVIGALCLYCHKKWLYFIPYTFMMFIVGVILGVCHAAHLPMGDLDPSISSWLSIDPHLLLAIFLPALIFADAMKMNIHLFRKCFWQCFLLSCPGVIASAYLMGCVGYYLLGQSYGYHFDWNLSMAFGSLLAAPDPVSVVAMLEAVNAPPKLTMIMSGESHLADLASYVMFSIFLQLSTHAIEPKKVPQFVATMVFGGPLFGIGLGLFALWAIRQNIAPQRNSDVMIQITITISLAYLSFIVSENNLKGNGIVATVCSAVIIAYAAWPSFASIETMENVWHAIEYFGNTIIFCLAGLFFGDILYAIADHTLDATIIPHAIAAYAALYAIRLGIVFILYPFLRKLGYGLPLNHAAVLVWGGLRGAVAMSLAIVVLQSAPYIHSEDKKFDPEKGLKEFFFIVGFIVMMSLTFNSTTCPLLMKYTHVLSRSTVKKQLLHHVKDRLIKRAYHTFEHVIKENPEFKDVPIETVMKVSSNLRKAVQDGKHVAVEEKKDETPAEIEAEKEADYLVLLNVRELFLDALKGAYWEQIEQGILPKNAQAAQVLLESCELAKDRAGEKLSDFEYLSLPTEIEDDQQALHERIFDFIDKCLPQWVTIDDYFGAKLHAKYRQEAVYMASCFIAAHKVAQQRVAEYVGEGEDADSPEEVKIIEESEEEIKLAQKFLDVATARDSHIVDLIKAKKVASIILLHEAELVEELNQRGIIDARTTLEFRDSVRKDNKRLLNLQPEISKDYVVAHKSKAIDLEAIKPQQD